MSQVMNEQDHSRLLIDRAQAGDRAAIEELARCYEGSLQAVVRAKLGPRLEKRVEVEDIVQETLLRAFKALSGFRWREPDSFIRWLSRIAGNVIHEVAKREKHDWVVLVEDPASETEVTQSHAMRRNERFDRLQSSLDSLNPEQREAVVLARVDGLPIKEIARRMNRSPEAVTQLIWRAMQKLKASFPRTESFGLPDRRFEVEGGQDE